MFTYRADEIVSNDCATIVVIDDNDKPYLDLPETQRTYRYVCYVDENNNEGSGSDRAVDLLTYAKDEDEKDAWKCCASSTPLLSQSAIKQL